MKISAMWLCGAVALILGGCSIKGSHDASSLHRRIVNGVEKNDKNYDFSANGDKYRAELIECEKSGIFLGAISPAQINRPSNVQYLAYYKIGDKIYDMAFSVISDDETTILVLKGLHEPDDTEMSLLDRYGHQ